jgi:hypothetical protein
MQCDRESYQDNEGYQRDGEDRELLLPVLFLFGYV